MTLGGIRKRLNAISAFLADTRASVSVDFIVSMPILLAVLVLTSEYGRVLQMRTALDNAVADANRYLARVPFDDVNNRFDPAVVAQAEQLIRSRINTRFIAISEPRVRGDDDFRTVQLSAAVGIVSPALAVLSLGFQSDQGSTKFNSDGEPLGKTLQSRNGIDVQDIQGLVITTVDTARHFGR